LKGYAAADGIYGTCSTWIVPTVGKLADETRAWCMRGCNINSAFSLDEQLSPLAGVGLKTPSCGTSLLAVSMPRDGGNIMSSPYITDIFDRLDLTQETTVRVSVLRGEMSGAEGGGS
jgi:hypothetical protein